MERLISFVKDFPLLYDMTDKEYKDNLKKVAAWNEIAHHLKLESGEHARKKWRNLRDSFVKYLKTVNEPIAGRSTLKYRKWPWAKQMEFLKPHISTKESTTSNVLRPDVGLLVSTEYEAGPNGPSQLDTTPWPHDVFAEPSPPKRKRVVDSKALLNCSSSDYGHSRNMAKEGMDATDLLFLSYSRTLKSFSNQRQTATKMKINQIMIEAETDQNNENNQMHRPRQHPAATSVAPAPATPTFNFEAFGHAHPGVAPSPSAFNKF